MHPNLALTSTFQCWLCVSIWTSACSGHRPVDTIKVDFSLTVLKTSPPSLKLSKSERRFFQDLDIESTKRQSDPRSYIIRKVADEVFAVTGKDELLDTAMVLHDAAIKVDYLVSRKLAPNVDFWSGLIYRAMAKGGLGFPLDFFPILFVVPRVVGWLAHWGQMMLDRDGVKIWRPRQVLKSETTFQSNRVSPLKARR
ncbi:citrate synthase [Leucogyrophana mollusca]|uniref:Citrate synthase n=1 Tax=Leucogyrophana mollusca TaxID=85980 RepID=A0ACB8B151_9AGAM|nr:citrate synthase [Leucogyrophana mollusca]